MTTPSQRTHLPYSPLTLLSFEKGQVELEFVHVIQEDGHAWSQGRAKGRGYCEGGLCNGTQGKRGITLSSLDLVIGGLVSFWFLWASDISLY